MRPFPARATALCLAVIPTAMPAAASSLTMIYQANDYASQTNLLPPIPGAYGQVISGATGGAASGGQVFVLIPGKKGAYTKSLLHTFSQATQATDGWTLSQTLVADSHGNVWGATSQGGANNTGTVFELVAPTTSTGTWGYKSAASLPVFPTSNGGADSLAFDSHGNLFGISAQGCSANDCGSVFEVTAATLAGGAAPAKLVINAPTSLGTTLTGLTLDTKGNLYGTTYGGGSYSYGTVWQISPGAKGQPYSFSVIHSFCSVQDSGGDCLDGFFPSGGVTFHKGVLYGTADDGGAPDFETNPNTGIAFNYGANGVAFAMTPPASPGAAWTYTTLHTQQDYVAWNTPGPDYNVHVPQTAPVVTSTGMVEFATVTGGVLGAAPNTIYGGVISVNPATGADSIVSNAFAVQSGTPRSGPILDINHPMAIHLDKANRVYGAAGSAYDAVHATYSYWGVIYRIVP